MVFATVNESHTNAPYGYPLLFESSDFVFGHAALLVTSFVFDNKQLLTAQL